MNNNISKPDINNFAKHAKARLSERGITVNDVLLTNILIDTESLFKNNQFLDIIKYINTKK